MSSWRRGGPAPEPEARRAAGRRGDGLLHDVAGELEARFGALKETLAPADGLWIAWPKKASRIETDLDFDAVQRVGLGAGLVDNKSCAIDEDWQAVRFVYRLADRP